MAAYSSKPRSTDAREGHASPANSARRQNWKMQIEGQGRQLLMKILDDETEQAKVDMAHGGIEQIFEEATKEAGISETQYRDWGEAGGAPGQKGRSSVLSKRRKTRQGRNGRINRELRAGRGKRTRRTQRARERTRKAQEEQQWSKVAEEKRRKAHEIEDRNDQAEPGKKQKRGGQTRASSNEETGGATVGREERETKTRRGKACTGR